MINLLSQFVKFKETVLHKKDSLSDCFFLVLCALFWWPVETDNPQRGLDNDSAQHLKLKERQRFFEEVYQHDVDNYLPSAHLQIDCRKRE